MSGGSLVRCDACGGTVVYDVAVEGAACLFCGTVALKAVQPEEPPPVPDLLLPVEVKRDRADREFRAWARSSWWYPRRLRQLRIQLHTLLVPAWRFDSHLETHWAGLEPAATRSGKRPRAGLEHQDVQRLVPASGGVSQAELRALEPYDPDRAVLFDAAEIDLPYEPPQLSERGARHRAHALMTEEHQERIARQHRLSRCKVSPVIDDKDVKLLVVPLYIGAFTFRDRPWRFLVNGQTGEVVGRAPIDRVKVALVSAAGALAVALAALALVYAR